MEHGGLTTPIDLSGFRLAIAVDDITLNQTINILAKSASPIGSLVAGSV